MHQKALVAVNSDEQKRATRKIDTLQMQVSDKLDKVRNSLSRIAAETKRMKGAEVSARRAQQSSAARRLMDVARKYEEIQERYKLKYKQRIARELKIARPDATEKDIDQAVSHGGAVFAQQMLSGRVAEQQEALRGIK